MASRNGHNRRSLARGWLVQLHDDVDSLLALLHDHSAALSVHTDALPALEAARLPVEQAALVQVR